MADSERILAEEIEHAQTAEEVEAALTDWLQRAAQEKERIYGRLS